MPQKSTYLTLTLLLLGILLTYPRLAISQRVSIDYILGTPETVLARFNVDTLHHYQFKVPFSFAEEQIQPKILRRIRTESIYQIDLVFSEYRTSGSFSQKELNRKRLEYLQRVAPELFANSAIRWNLIRQTEASTREQAAQLYHGYVFHCRSADFVDKSTKKSYRLDRMAEIDLLHAMLGDTMEIGYSSSLPFGREATRDTIMQEVTERRYRRDTTGLWVPASRHRRKKGIRLPQKGIWARKLEVKRIPYEVSHLDTVIVTGGVILRDFMLPEVYSMDALTTNAMFADTVVLKTFREHPEWKNVLVVEDVTGSMSPYLGQTLLWRRLCHPEIADWAFFNDGDSKPDGPIGKSNGVYYIHSSEEKPVEDRLAEAMRRGYGGMGPENDIEAMIRALKQCENKPEAIILVADNYAKVRDLRLFGLLQEKQVPIYVILCGTSYGSINADYLEMARRTKGKVFTIEGEIEGLLETREGKIVKVGNQNYRVENGNLVLTR
jgi:hypothetical protein